MIVEIKARCEEGKFSGKWLEAGGLRKRRHLTGAGRLACRAFWAVFQRRQTRHATLLTWLNSSLAAVSPTCRTDARIMDNAAAGRA